MQHVTILQEITVALATTDSSVTVSLAKMWTNVRIYRTIVEAILNVSTPTEVSTVLVQPVIVAMVLSVTMLTNV